MCGRYLLTAPIDAIEDLFPLPDGDPRPGIPPRFNVAPRQPVLVIRKTDKGVNELAAVEWGLVPEWKKEIGDKPLKRALETVEAKPSFRSSIKRKRCLVPFTGWYEWRTENGRKQPYVIEPAGGDLMAFAGIWSAWHGPGGDNWLETMAIVTDATTGPMKKACITAGRFVVPENQFEDWLEPHDPLPRGFLNGFDWVPETAFQWRPVSTRVGNVRFDDPSLLEPPETERQQSLF